MHPKLIILYLVFFSLGAHAQSEKCSDLDSKIDQITESMDYHSKSLRPLILALKKEPNCDDASYAEGMTDIVVRVLEADLKNVLKDYTSKSDQKFILGHINATASTKDLERVANSLKQVCKTKPPKFCGELAKSLKAAIRESEK